MQQYTHRVLVGVRHRVLDYVSTKLSGKVVTVIKKSSFQLFTFQQFISTYIGSQQRMIIQWLLHRVRLIIDNISPALCIILHLPRSIRVWLLIAWWKFSSIIHYYRMFPVNSLNMTQHCSIQNIIKERCYTSHRLRSTGPFIYHNRPFAQGHHFTTTTRILQGFAFLRKLRILLFKPTGITKFKYERKSQEKITDSHFWIF